MKRLLPFLSMLALLVAVSCSPANQALKRSKNLAKNGLTYEATMAALDALEAKPGYQKAMVQVKQLGKKEIHLQLRQFDQLADAGEIVGALDAFIRAEDIERRANASGVLLTGSDTRRSEYNALRAGLIQDYQAQGRSALERGEYESAQRILERALHYAPEDESLRSDWTVAVATPRLNDAKRELGEGHFRSAYYILADMEAMIEQPFDNSRALQDSAVRSGQITVGIRDVIAPTRQELDLANGLRADLINFLIQTQDPFITWLDYNEKARFQVDERPDYVLNLEMTDWQEMPGTVSRYERHGYRKVVSKVKDPDTGETKTETDYVKVIYFDVDYRYFVAGALTFSIVETSADAQKILATEEVSASRERIIATAEYSGNAADLYPGQWNRIDKDDASDRVILSGRSALSSRLRTRNNPSLIHSMRTDVRDELMRKTASAMFDMLHNPVYLP